jgi:hypothetical protein
MVNKEKALWALLNTLLETIEELQQTRLEVAANLEEKAMSMHSAVEKLRKMVDWFQPVQ